MIYIIQRIKTQRDSTCGLCPTCFEVLMVQPDSPQQYTWAQCQIAGSTCMTTFGLQICKCWTRCNLKRWVLHKMKHSGTGNQATTKFLARVCDSGRSSQSSNILFSDGNELILGWVGATNVSKETIFSSLFSNLQERNGSIIWLRVNQRVGSNPSGKHNKCSAAGQSTISCTQLLSATQANIRRRIDKSSKQVLKSESIGLTYRKEIKQTFAYLWTSALDKSIYVNTHPFVYAWKWRHEQQFGAIAARIRLLDSKKPSSHSSKKFVSCCENLLSLFLSL